MSKRLLIFTPFFLLVTKRIEHSLHYFNQLSCLLQYYRKL